MSDIADFLLTYFLFIMKWEVYGRLSEGGEKMAIDISTLNSIYNSYIGTSNSSSITSNSTGTSFIDTLLKESSALDKLNGNSILPTLLTNNSSSTLQSLLTNKTNTDNSSTYLETSIFDTNEGETKDTFIETLQSQFQASQLKLLNSAKSNLEAQRETFIEKNADNLSSATKARLEEMQHNISLLEQFISTKTSEASTQNSLLNALSANASLTQSLLSKNNL